MFHLDNGSGVDTMPVITNKQSDKIKWFTEGDNTNNPSYPGQDWFNITQAEMLNVLSAAGITPQKTQLNQLAQAIQKIVNNGKAPNASTSVAGIVQLNSAINSTSETLAATPKAVKTAYDLANAANTTSITAKNTADTAKTTADAANTRALTATSTANAAKTTAETNATTSVAGRVKLNTATNSTSTTEAATPSAVKAAYDLANKTVGVNQVWQDVTSSRSADVVYTNTTGKPIMIAITGRGLSNNVSTYLEINGVKVIEFGSHPSTGINRIGSVIVPVGSTYSMNTHGSSVLISLWSELK